MNKLILAVIVGALGVVSASLTSCETDFSLNGNYRITPVVFGLLDQNNSTHLIKITRAYLGDGDNLVYAQNPDSNYFESVNAVITEYVDNAETGKSWTLYDSLITTKSTDGLFYGPEQKVYVFNEPDLKPNAEYELNIDINEGQHKVKGRTSMLEGFGTSPQLSLATYKVNFNVSLPSVASDYNLWLFDIKEALNAADYNYKYILNFTEYYLDGTDQSFALERNNGNKLQEKASNPQNQSATFGGLDFFQWVQSEIPDDNNVEYRRMDGLDLKISVAHKDLAQYMDVSEPVTGITQNNPTYTNLEGSLGLFSSRYIYRQNSFRLVKNSLRELCRGQYTGTKKFCSQWPEDATESWSCP